MLVVADGIAANERIRLFSDSCNMCIFIYARFFPIIFSHRSNICMCRVDLILLQLLLVVVSSSVMYNFLLILLSRTLLIPYLIILFVLRSSHHTQSNWTCPVWWGIDFVVRGRTRACRLELCRFRLSDGNHESLSTQLYFQRILKGPQSFISCGQTH